MTKEYTASGIREFCGRYKNAAAKEAIRHDLERASDKYAASGLKQLFRGNETQEDNATSVQSQHRVKSESGNEGGFMRTIEG